MKPPAVPYSVPAPICDLPPFPDPAPVAVGFPDPDSIMMTKTDFQALLMYVEGLRFWIEAAGACLRGQMRFADSIDDYLRARQ